MNIKINFPPKKNKAYLENFFKKMGLSEMVGLSKKKLPSVKSLGKIKSPYLPDLRELYNLYHYVVLNKRITIMEFGSGWSSLIFNLALLKLKKNYSKDLVNFRKRNQFELFIIENEKKYLKITKEKIRKLNKLIKPDKKIKINFNYSDVEMTVFNNQISTQYKKLPICNPDFIYLDGPDQFKIKKNVNGINLNHQDMMPMACDILKFEYFYIPGTIIVIDGRAANAKFLKDNFKRKWRYINDKKADQHLFVLIDPILGEINKKQLDFYNS